MDVVGTLLGLGLVGGVEPRSEVTLPFNGGSTGDEVAVHARGSLDLEVPFGVVLVHGRAGGVGGCPRDWVVCFGPADGSRVGCLGHLVDLLVDLQVQFRWIIQLPRSTI